MHVIATAGHVDHGKSTLVRALTGTDPDRLEEEKARGLTIDLGFAFTDVPSGRKISFIDVPGHVRFLKNMLAGVGGVDACMFVVAAPEGWKPQSEEHLRILELLGIEHGIVALTQIGLVDDDIIELAQLDIEERTAGSFLEGAPVIGVDSIAGTGLGDLRAALDTLTETTPTAIDNGRPRLWIDRAFAATGSGSVVTGTLTGGRIRVDDELTLVPGERTVRVRAIQTQGEQRTKIGPGHRVAVNLTGASVDQLGRGLALVRGDQWHRTDHVDAQLTVLPHLDHEISRRGAFAVYIGSGEYPARLRVLGPTELFPGTTGNIRMFLDRPLPLLPGDRFILRDFGRDETVGGGHILDVDPIVKASVAAPDLSVDRVIDERGWLDVDHLERLTGQRRPPTVGRWVASPRSVADTSDHLRRLIQDAGSLGLDMARLDEKERLLLETFPDVSIADGRARPVDQDDVLAEHPVLALLASEPFAPPQPDDVDPDEIRALVQRGLVVAVDGILFAPSAIDQAAQLIAGLLSDKPDGVTVAEVRDALGTTRKYMLPLLARLDGTGVTRRRGDLRIAGPRLPDLAG